MAKQYIVDPSTGGKELVTSEVGAWQAERNAAWTVIDRRFTLPKASEQLKKLYPVEDQ